MPGIRGWRRVTDIRADSWFNTGSARWSCERGHFSNAVCTFRPAAACRLDQSLHGSESAGRSEDLPAEFHTALINSTVALLLTAVSFGRARQNYAHQRESKVQLRLHRDGGGGIERTSPLSCFFGTVDSSGCVGKIKVAIGCRA